MDKAMGWRTPGMVRNGPAQTAVVRGPCRAEHATASPHVTGLASCRPRATARPGPPHPLISASPGSPPPPPAGGNAALHRPRKPVGAAGGAVAEALPSPPGVTCRTVSRGAAGRAGPAPAVRPRDHFAPAVARSPAGPLAPFLRKPMSSYTGERKPKEPALTRFLRAAVSWGRW